MGEEGSAAQEMSQILDCPPAVTEANLRADTALTQRWRHGPLHDYLRPLNSHVIMTYYSEAQNILLKSDSKRVVSTTRPGTLTVIPSGSDGRWDIAGEIEVSHVYLPEERLRQCVEAMTGGKNFELLGRVGFDDPSAARILELLSREASNPDPSSTLFIEQAIDLLCMQLVRGHSSLNSLPEPEATRGLAEWQVKKVTQYMREHLADEIGLDELAGLIQLSRFYFCTAFRLATGQTPHDWLRAERIARARKLLADPLLSITDIGLSVGYGTPSSFAAAFRKLVGLTPSQFRLRS